VKSPSVRGSGRAALALMAAAGAVSCASSTPVVAPAQPPPIGREAALALEYPPLAFEPPTARLEHVGPGVPVLFVEDHSLPLVDVFARFEGGYGLFGRERYAAATALPGLLRNGGTTTLAPDSVDRLLETYAAQANFGSGGESAFAGLKSLRSTLDESMAVWTDMLRNPRFDSAQVEVWRGQEMDRVIRRKDDPRLLAYSEFNRLMYGDHPTGWEMGPGDLVPEALANGVFHQIHREIFCPEHLVLGVTGDLTWEEARTRLETMLAGWPPCRGELPRPPMPQIRHDPGVYLIPRELEQSTIVMAHATEVRQGNTPEYFSSRIGHAILGNSGFSSRLVSRVRTERGYAYSASSLWTTPLKAPGLVGAVTQTRGETTISAIQLILEIMEEMRTTPPTEVEVRLAVDQAVNGFVFNFQDPAQVVSRQMLYLTRDMGADWLERYLEGIQDVLPSDVRDVFADHVRPEEMTILILGDPDTFELPPEVLGEVRIWEVEGVTDSGR